MTKPRKSPNKIEASIPFLQRPGGDVPHAWGYGRVSTLDQDLECKAQIVVIERTFKSFYEPRGYAWGGSFLDPATAAYSPLADRDASKAMLSLLRKDDVIIVAKSDRFSKSLYDFAKTLEMLTAIGAFLHTCDTGLNTSTDMGRLITGITALLGNHERERMSTRRREQIEAMRLAGLCFGHETQWGFRLEFVRESGGKKLFRKVPDLYSQLVMERVFYWNAACGISGEKIAAHLNKYKVRNTRGRVGKFSSGDITHIIAAWAVLEGTELDIVQKLTPEERVNYYGNQPDNFARTKPNARLASITRRGKGAGGHRLRFLGEADYIESARLRALALRDGEPEQSGTGSAGDTTSTTISQEVNGQENRSPQDAA